MGREGAEPISPFTYTLSVKLDAFSSFFIKIIRKGLRILAHAD